MFSSVENYYRFAANLKGEPKAVQTAVCRELAQTDLFFLLWFVCGRKNIARPWLFDC